MSGGSLLIDHYRHPRCRGEVEDPTCRHEVYNRKCGDRITLTARVESDRLKEIRFEGEGCMYCLASASILCSTLSGLPPGEARRLVLRFREWIRGEGGAAAQRTSDVQPGAEEAGSAEAGRSADPDLTEGMQALGEVKAFPMRIDCADLAWKCAEVILESGRDRRDANG
jgi:nitrogen fixation protein NifU and related proteins